MGCRFFKKSMVSVCLLFSFFFSSTLHAESVSLEGLTFEVDQVRELTNGSIQVKIAGQDLLLEESGWREEALRLCLIKFCDSLKPEKVLPFALQYQQRPQANVKMLKALNFYFRSISISSDLVAKFRYELISAYSQSEKAGQAYLLQTCAGEIRIADICDPLQILKERFSTALKLINSGRAEGALLLLSGLKNSQEIQPLITPIVRSLKSIAESSDPEVKAQILKVVTLIPTDLVTQDFLDFFQDQLSQLKDISVAPQIFERLVAAHVKVIEGNKEFARLLEDVVSQQVNQSFKSGDLERSKMFLGSWLILAGRPEFLSTDSLLQLYIWLNRFGRSEQAEKIYAQVSDKLGIFDLVRLFFVRHFPSVNYVFLIVLAVLLALTLIVVVLTKRKFEDEPINFEETFGTGNDEPEQPKVFSVGALAISPRMLRYKECLRVIGLSGPATVRDIKAAYRAAVKESHPDLKGDHGGQTVGQSQSDRFIELTQAYDEALHLHAEIGADHEAI
jgi:hypothetical protein